MSDEQFSTYDFAMKIKLDYDFTINGKDYKAHLVESFFSTLLDIVIYSEKKFYLSFIIEEENPENIVFFITEKKFVNSIIEYDPKLLVDSLRYVGFIDFADLFTEQIKDVINYNKKINEKFVKGVKMLEENIQKGE